jgi:YkoY family integral membrane protein
MEFINYFLGDDLAAAGFVILNLILIESLLSVDNAAVLATMVMDLPEHQRPKALKWGIIGAYVFRGLALLFASLLIKIWWLKVLGGLYLLYLCFDYFYTESTPDEKDDLINKKENFLYKRTFGLMGQFWATVAMVEVMDLAFSIDNVFAAAALTDNMFLICTGVFIGILAMRFVAQSFVNLMQRYPFLETAAFIVIGILGLKLSLALYTHFFKDTHEFAKILESEHTDLWVSIGTMLVFFVPILTSILFGFPKSKSKEPEKKEL